LAQLAGFDNFSVDLIYGTPGLTDEDWKQNIDTVIGLGIPHVACYALTVEPRTALQKMIRLHKKTDIDSDQQATQFLLLMQWMKAAGYEHYEISNFSQPGFRSRHNSAYWQGIKYIGIGPSAHSFNGTSRRWNVANNAMYLQSITNNVIPFEEEKLSPAELLNEYVMTALRTLEGIDLVVVEEKFSLQDRNRIAASIDGLLRRGMIHFNGRTIVLTDEGKLFADGIAADLFRVPVHSH
jgi:oxygen-independent coproporphyrinogen-3 oxidase